LPENEAINKAIILMKRKEFLRNMSLLAGGVGLGIDNIPVRAYAHNPVMMDLAGTNGKILVLVQLSGGNDGLNTVIPVEDDIYFQKRPNIALKKADVLRLNPQTGLHPSMGSLKRLFDDSKVSLVQNVGYASPNRSHFRSTDIWLSATDANVVNNEGWAGKYLSQVYPEYPIKLPAQPLAIQLGSVESMLLQTDLGSMGTVFEDPNTFFQLVNGSTSDNDPVPNTLAGDELRFMKQIAAASIQYSGIIKQKADLGKNTYTYPNTNLGRQLAIVAKLISGGAETPVYLTNIGGFDTHAAQLNQHANLLKTVSEAVATFQLDLEKQGIANNVTLMTFSEFGRRLNENGTTGTDHGTAAPLFVVGSTVRGGIIGSNPSLTDLDASGDIKFKHDYRQIYGTILQDHLGVNDTNVKQILGRNFDKLPIYRAAALTETGKEAFSLAQNYPNPAQSSTRFSYELFEKQEIRLSVYDMLGQEVSLLREGTHEAGFYSFELDVSRFTKGQYLYALASDKGHKTLRMSVV
jgi:uncharacterized protein (DUF1501 family)